MSCVNPCRSVSGGKSVSPNAVSAPDIPTTSMPRMRAPAMSVGTGGGAAARGGPPPPPPPAPRAPRGKRPKGPDPEPDDKDQSDRAHPSVGELDQSRLRRRAGQGFPVGSRGGGGERAGERV